MCPLCTVPTLAQENCMLTNGRACLKNGFARVDATGGQHETLETLSRHNCRQVKLPETHKNTSASVQSSGTNFKALSVKHCLLKYCASVLKPPIEASQQVVSRNINARDVNAASTPPEKRRAPTPDVSV